MRISVVIPALNEEQSLPAALATVRTQRPTELIVVDGGSVDRTVEVARSLADRVLTGARGRSAQMNLGAEQTTGDVLLFLHADCTLEAGALREIEHWMGKPGVAAGCFRMTLPAGNLLYRCIDSCASARVRLFGIPYGDQGLFLRRETFERAGGFSNVRLMEDVLMSLRLRKMGRIVVGRKRIFVSPRRWQRVGIIRQTLRNWALTGLAAAGWDPNQLARHYPHIR